MELNYIKEHTSCVNYKTEEDARLFHLSLDKGT